MNQELGRLMCLRNVIGLVVILSPVHFQSSSHRTKSFPFLQSLPLSYTLFSTLLSSSRSIVVVVTRR